MAEQLAIAGGEPVFPNGPPDWPTASPEIIESVQDALRDGYWGKYESLLTEQLCEKVSELFNNEHVLLCSSGTIAVELALRGVGVKQGDEVILAGYDFPGNFRAIEAAGAFPVLVDVVEGGWTMNADLVSNALSEKTKAVLVSHLHGQVADIRAIRNAISGKEDVAIVEDNCQSPGGLDGNLPLGAQADVGVLSFGGSKLLSAGRGGAVLTNDEDVLQRAKIFSNRGNDAFPFSQLQAAALLPQLETLAAMSVLRHSNVKMLLELTKDQTVLSPLKQLGQENTLLPAYYKLAWLFHPTANLVDRQTFICAIQAEGVAIDSGFRGFTKRSKRRCRISGALSHSQAAADSTLLLHHPVLLKSEAVIEKVAHAILKVIAGFAG